MNSVSLPSVEMNKNITRISKRYVEYDPRSGSNTMRRAFNRFAPVRDWQSAFSGRQPYTGSQWWALTGECVRWMLAEIDQNQRFVDFCKGTRTPDEHSFQTLLHVSTFADQREPTILWSDYSRPTGPKPTNMDTDHVQEMIFKELAFDQDGYGIVEAVFARKFFDAETTRQVRELVWPLTAPLPRT